MNADLLAMLGGAGIPGASSRRANDEGKTILSFKAGKMTSAQQPNGKYLITPDVRRGEIKLTYRPSPRTPGSSSASTSASSSSSVGTLQFSWKDRRTQSTSDEMTVFPSDRINFRKVNTGKEEDRVYLLQFGSNTDRRFFYWLQYLAKEEDEQSVKEMDEHHAKEMNKFLADLGQAAAAAGDENVDYSAVTAPASTTTPARPSSSSSQQVDALSNILENLGMPQPIPSTLPSSTTTPATPSTSATTANGGTLTLADLQGAMATLATSSPPPTPSLTDIINQDSVESSQILQNPQILETLLPLLPENQRSEEFLRENLRSPQFRETLKTLQGVLTGSPDGLSTVLANFQLDVTAAEGLGGSGKTPLEIFLEAVQKSVVKEGEEKEETKDEEMKED